MGDQSVGHGVAQHARWFVSAGSGVDLTGIIAELRQRGAEPYVLSDVAELGAEVLDSIRQAIGRSDQVILVLGEGAVSSNVMFEAGIAVGLGKPVLLVANPHIKLPSDLAGVLTVRADSDDLAAIGFALDQAQGRMTRLSRHTAPTGRALGPEADDLLVQLATADPISESAAIEILKEALESSGVIAAEGNRPDGRFDLGIWSDDLDAIAANPLLIEVKKTLHAGAMEQVLRLLADSHTARAALVVSLTPVSGKAMERLSHSGHMVWAITLHELIERMRLASFAEVVRNLRNRSVHGLPT